MTPLPAHAAGFNSSGGWVRWVLLAAGGLFALGVPVNLVSGDLPNALVGALIAGLGIGGFFFITSAQRERARFLGWLFANAESVRGGSAEWQGHRINPGTELRSYDVAVSLLVVSTRFTTRFVLPGEASADAVRWSATLASLALGPWGIPFGPIFTMQALFKNLRGGHQTTAGALLDALVRP